LVGRLEEIERMNTDDALDSEGNTFERKALLKWLQKSNQSPVSRQNVNENVLVPNLALRELIHNAMGEKWVVSRLAELDVEFGPSRPANDAPRSIPFFQVPQGDG
jgi:hypothetical protein